MGDFDFRALGCKDAHVALMYDRGNYTDRFFHVIFGVSNNVRIGIRTEKGALAPYNIDGTYMDCYNWKQFRICEYMLTNMFRPAFWMPIFRSNFLCQPPPLTPTTPSSVPTPVNGLLLLTYTSCLSWQRLLCFLLVSSAWDNGTISVFIEDGNKTRSFDTGIVFDVNYIVLSAYGTVQVCWQVFAGINIQHTINYHSY